MITREQIQANADRFEELINSISREFDKERFLQTIENSDFYTAPASTKYHCAYEGGLVQHCLNVYDNLKKINESLGFNFTEDTIIICALAHDLSKMNLYEKTYVNKKIYNDHGKKSDENGKFDWVSVPGYSTKDLSKRFIFGNHEQTAEFMARSFIPLTIDESVAILHHMGGQGWDSTQISMSDVYTKYPLALALHVADLVSTYWTEIEA